MMSDRPTDHDVRPTEHDRPCVRDVQVLTRDVDPPRAFESRRLAWTIARSRIREHPAPRAVVGWTARDVRRRRETSNERARAMTGARGAHARARRTTSAIGACAIAIVARGARASAIDDANAGEEGGVTPFAARAKLGMEGANERTIAALGFALKDVMPDVAATYLPHGAKGWAWVYGSEEYKSFTCKYDATLGAVDPNDPSKPKILLRFGTYGVKEDTGTTIYDEAWFKDPEHFADIKWTYRFCEDGERVACASSTFAMVDPFPSIPRGQKGKRCQYIDTRSIPGSSRDPNMIGPEGDRKDTDSLNVAIQTYLNDAVSGDIVQSDVKILAPALIIKTITAQFPDMKAQNLEWKWCANEGKEDENRCECDTIMRYGWTGDTTTPAPTPQIDATFVRWIYVDKRNEEKTLRCNSAFLGEIIPWPQREENSRICQCLSKKQMDEIDNVVAQVVGGPVDFINPEDISSSSSTGNAARLGKSPTASTASSAGASNFVMALMALSAAVVAIVFVKRSKVLPKEYEPLLETSTV